MPIMCGGTEHKKIALGVDRDDLLRLLMLVRQIWQQWKFDSGLTKKVGALWTTFKK